MLEDRTVPALSAGNIQVVQNSTADTAAAVTLVTNQATVDFAVVGALSNRGDYAVQVGASAADDVAGGVLMTSLREVRRNNGEAAPVSGIRFGTSAVYNSGSGYAISVTDSPQGTEYNFNVAAAYFPVGEYQSGKIAAPGGAGGVTLTVPGVANPLTDGILLVNGAQDGDRIGLSQPSATNWTIFSKDNGVNSTVYTAGDVYYVYVPLTTPTSTAIIGRVTTDGGTASTPTAALFQGATAPYSVSRTGVGTYLLTIPGQTPTSGVLIVSPEGGVGGNNADNIVSYQVNGNSWEIHDLDLSDSPTQPAEQDFAVANVGLFNFIFIPIPPPTGAILDVNALGQLTYTAGAGMTNNLTVSEVGGPGGTIQVSDTGEVITLTAAALAAGYTGTGTNNVTGPSSVVSAMSIDVGAQNDTVTLNTITKTLTVIGGGSAGDTLVMNDSVTTSGAVSLTGFGNSISLAAGKLITASSVTVSGGVIGAVGAPIATTTATIVATATGGLFLAETDGAAVTANVTGTGAASITNATGTLSVAGSIVTAAGNVTINNSGTNLAVNASINTSSGTVTLTNTTGTLTTTAAITGTGIVVTNNGSGTTLGNGASAANLTSTTGGISVTNAAGSLVTTANTALVSTTGNISLANNGADLTIGNTGSSITTTSGNVSLTSANAINLQHNIAGGSGTVTIAANTDGAGTEGFTQTNTRSIVTTNTTAGAVSITVNTAGGGTGAATVTETNANGGTLTINANGGSIVFSNTGTFNIGATASTYSGTQFLRATTFFLSTSGAGAIGSATVPLELSTNAAGRSATINSGTGGIFIADNDGGGDLTVSSANAAGGDVLLVANSASPGSIIISGQVNTQGAGQIRILADDLITLGALSTIGGSGFSGTVLLQANYDGTNEQGVTMVAGSSIATANTTASAVRLEGFGLTNATNAPQMILGSIAAGNGGAIAVVSGARAGATGQITQLPGTTLNAGPLGTIVLTAIDNPIGTAAAPITVAGGTVIATANSAATSLFAGQLPGSIFVTSTGAATMQATTNTAGARVGAITLSTSAGALTIGGATNADDGVVTLTGATGVTVNGVLGDANTTGAINIAATTGNVSVVVNPDRTVAHNLNITSGALVENVAAGPLTTPNLNLTGAAWNLQLNGTGANQFGQLDVFGTVNLGNASLIISLGYTPALNDTFVIINNDDVDTIGGIFNGKVDNSFFIVGTVQYQISYNNFGAGNDVAIRVTNPNISNPGTIDYIAGTQTLTYTASGGTSNLLTFGLSGGQYTFTDPGQTNIIVTAAATPFLVSNVGTTVVLNNSASIAAISIDTGDSDDATVINNFDKPLTIAAGGQTTDTVNFAFAGTITVAGNVTITGAGTIIQNANTLFNLGAGTFSATALTAIGTSGTPIRTTAATIVVSAGAGGAFVTESDGANFTGTATGAGNLTIINLAGPLTINGATSTVAGNLSISSADAVAVNASVGTASTTGTIAIAANTNAAGAEGFTQATAAIITTTNAGTSAFSLTVNTAGGGTGNATIGIANITGRYNATSNAGSILWNSGLGAYSGGVVVPGFVGFAGQNYSGNNNVSAGSYVFTATGAGSIGDSVNFIQARSLGGRTASLASGTGGIYFASNNGVSGGGISITQAIAQGAGPIFICTNDGGSHAMNLSGPITSGSGDIFIVCNDTLTLDTTAVIGGGSFSGTVHLRGNFDNGSAVNFDMVGNASITTTNATANAVLIEQTAVATTNVNLQNITVGNGGTITINASGTGTTVGGGGVPATINGNINIASGKTLNAGANGTIRLVTRDATIGSAALPIRVAGGNVIAVTNSSSTVAGNIFVTGTANTSMQATTTTNGASIGNITLATTAGTLFINGATNADSGTITLTGAAGIAVNAVLGDANTTGGMTLLATAGTVNFSVSPIAQPYAVTVSSGTLTETVSGPLALPALNLAATSSAAFTISGAVAFDQFTPTAAVALNAGTLAVSLSSFTPTNGQTFTLINGGASATITGQFINADTAAEIDNFPVAGLPGSMTAKILYGFDDGSDTNNIAIQFISLNANPIANSDTANAVEDGPAVSISVLANDTDPDVGQSLTVTGVSGGASGTIITFTPSGVTYNPGTAFQTLALGQTTTDTFNYTISDGNGGAASGSVTVTVTGVNDTPTAASASLNANEDGPSVTTSVLADDIDSNNDPGNLTYTITSPPTEGTAVSNGDGTFTFSPGSAFQDLGVGETRTVSFGYRASDVTAPPVVGTPQTVTASAASGGFVVSGSDLLQGLTPAVTGTALGGQEGTSANPAVLTDGSFGTANNVDATMVSIANNTTLTYTLNTGGAPNGWTISNVDVYSGWRDAGRDNLDYTVSYATAAAPNTFVSFPAISFAPSNPPSGKVSLSASNSILAFGVAKVRFTFGNQENGYVGYRELDVFGTPSPTPLTPQPGDQSITTQSAASGGFPVSASDILQGLTAAVTGTALNGDEGTSANPAVLTDGSFGTANTVNATMVTIRNNTTLTYTLPTAGAPLGYTLSGIDTYAGWQDAGRDNQNYTVAYATADAPNSFISLATIAFTPTSPPSGKVSIASSNSILAHNVVKVQFVFGAQENGYVGYRELDVFGTPTPANTSSAGGTVTITVSGVNDLPTAASVTLAAVEDGPNVTSAVIAVDADTTTPNIAILSTPTEGTITSNGNGTFTFANGGGFQDLNQGQVRSVSLNYQVTDDAAPVVPGTLSVVGQSQAGLFTVSNTDLLQGLIPASSGTALNGLEGTSANPAVLTDGTAGSVAPPLNTTLATIQDNTILTYTLPAATFGQTISSIDLYSGWQDGGRDRINVTVQYSIIASPNVFQTLTTVAYEPTTPPSGRATISASNSVVAVNVAKVRFVFGAQENGYVGYREIDVFGTPSAAPASAATGTVTVNVTGVNDTPTAAAATLATEENASVTTPVLTDDADAEDTASTLVYSIVTPPASGLAISNGNGTFTFNPNGAFNDLPINGLRTVSFVYRATDARGASSTNTVTVTVIGRNNAPTAATATLNALTNGPPVTSAVLADDVDSNHDANNLTYAIVTPPTEGSVVSNGNGTFSFNPGAGFQDLALGQTRNVTFTYSVRDVYATAAPATTTQAGTAFYTSPSDLIQGMAAVVTGTALGGQEGTSANPLILTDGFQGAPSAVDATNVSISDNTTLTYSLDTASFPLGFAIGAISTTGGWRDGGRDNQNYIVRYSLVGAPNTFIDLAAVNYSPPQSNSQVIIAPASGVLLNGVAKIQFFFGAQENGYVGYRELDVYGFPIAPTTATVTVTVTGTTNDPPVLGAPTNPVTVNEGSTANNTGVYADPNSSDNVTFTATMGGNPVGSISKTGTSNGSWNWTYNTTNGPSQSGTVLITATDGGNIVTTSFQLVVNNVAPNFSLAPDANLTLANSGLFTRSNIAFTDPGVDVWTGTVNYGDGSGVQTLTVNQSPKQFSLSHPYQLGGSYTVTVVIDDHDGGVTTRTMLVNVPQPTHTYADDDWAGFTIGQAIADADPVAGGAQPAVFGYDAFASPSAAIFAVAPAGNVTVNGGTYAETVTVNKNVALALQPGTAGNTSVVFSAIADSLGAATISLNTVTWTVGAGTVASPIGGNGSLVKNTAGTLNATGALANTYTGGTIVNDGTFALAKTAGVNALAGPVTIGDNIGGSSTAKTAILRVNASNQIPDGAAISFVGNDGRLHIAAGAVETIAAPAAFAAGDIKIAGTLIVSTDYSQPVGSTTTMAGGVFRVGANGINNYSLAGVLQGSGTIVTKMLTSTGTIDPSSGVADADVGNASPGYLTVRGNLQMTASSVTNLDVGAVSDQLNVGINTALPLPFGSYTAPSNYDLDPYLRGDAPSVTEQLRRGVNDNYNINGVVRFDGTLNVKPIAGFTPTNNSTSGDSMNFVWRALNLPAGDLDPRLATFASVPSDFASRNSFTAAGVPVSPAAPAGNTRFEARFMGSAGQANAIGQSVNVINSAGSAVLAAPAYVLGQAKSLALTALTAPVGANSAFKVTKQTWNATKDSHTRITVTMTNTGATPLAGPFYLEIASAPASTMVFNAAGKTQTLRPYLVAVPRDAAGNALGSLAAGASMTVEVDLLTPFTLSKTATLTVNAIIGGMP